MGGAIQAQNGIDVYQVGSERNGQAELICGLDFTVLDKITWARDQSLSLVKQLKTLEAYKKTAPEKAGLIAKSCAAVRAQILKLAEMARAFATQIDKNDLATVTVRGIVYPGTHIEICHVSHVVSRPMGKVRFLLDKGSGKIRSAPL